MAWFLGSFADKSASCAQCDPVAFINAQFSKGYEVIIRKKARSVIHHIKICVACGPENCSLESPYRYWLFRDRPDLVLVIVQSQKQGGGSRFIPS